MAIGERDETRADPSRVQRLAGHASPTTTGRYDRRPEDALREAAALVHVPYHRRPARADG